jgi:hypothetical protein
MNTKLNSKTRKRMKDKLSVVFNDELQTLSGDYREIILDDLVSAFENRFEVLMRVQQSSKPCFEMTSSIAIEAV